jgi:hypothetical protein
VPAHDASNFGAIPEENASAAVASQLQALATHVSVGPHVRPQAPQFVGSFDVSTQAVPHMVPPPGQTQRPPLHSRPAAQAESHAPQWSVLVFVSTQLDPHWVSEPQPAAQLESKQTSPTCSDARRSTPHLAQLVWENVRACARDERAATVYGMSFFQRSVRGYRVPLACRGPD